MPNVKPSLKKENLEYNVTVGIVNIIKLPGVTRDLKHDDTFEKITVEHLTAENDWVTVFPSEDLFESAFSLRIITLDEIMIGQKKKIQFKLRSSNGKVSDKYSVELNFIKNPAPVLDLKQEEELEDSIF